MPKAANVKFNVINKATIATTPLDGVSYVAGITERGPFGDPKEIITNWTQYVKLFGGLISNSDFPLLCKRALDAGASLRVNRVGHYTDTADKSTLDAVLSDIVKPTTLIFDADFVTSNTIDMNINGTAINTVPFDTDQSTTIKNLATEISTNSKAAVLFVELDEATKRLVIYPRSNTPLAITSIVVASGASQANGVAAAAPSDFIDVALNPLFKINPLYKGASYNNLYVTISDASNGQAEYFKLGLGLKEDGSVNESYDNLKITGTPTVGVSDYLDIIDLNSKVVSVSYIDLSSLTGQLRPTNGMYLYSGGSDGTAPSDTDYIGSSVGKTGLYAFDEYDEGFYLATPEISSSSVNIAGSTYAAARKDIIFFAHLSNLLTTSTALISNRSATLIDNQYVAFYGGGIKVLHPDTLKEVHISEIGDVLGLAAKVHTSIGQWRSFAGQNNGKVTGALGVVNNYGSNGLFKELNDLANRQINMLIRRDNVVQLSGNFTGVVAESPESFNSVVSLIIYIQKLLKPVLNSFLEEPADPTTFNSIWYTVQPLLDELVSNRAIFEYKWDGDQYAGTLDNMQVNDPVDVQQGKYKINFYIKPINSLQEIEVNIILTNAGISFDIASA
jgi:hypothetical protein